MSRRVLSIYRAIALVPLAELVALSDQGETWAFGLISVLLFLILLLVLCPAMFVAQRFWALRLRFSAALTRERGN